MQLGFLKTFFYNPFSKLLINFLKYGFLTLFIIILINYAALNKEKEVLGRHGLEYDIGMGQKIFMKCKGEGLPTIIMESPLGLNSDIYLPLQTKLATTTKVCVYDRAGLGLSYQPYEPVVNKSEKAKPTVNRGLPFTVERMTEDLHYLITKASQPDRPIMFVGTEIGSIIARFYTQIYQDNVSHLVMINPLVENLFSNENSKWKDFWYKKVVPKYYGYALGSAVGLNRILMMFNLIKPQISFDEEELYNRQKHLICNPKHMFALLNEYTNLNETMAQMKLIWSIKEFPKNVSVTVLTSKKDKMFGLENSNQLMDSDLQKTWKDSVEFLKSKLHPNSKFYDVKESLYSKLYNEPDYFFSLIKDLITEWRLKNPKVVKE